MAFDNAIILLANYYQFAKGERIVQPCINSRMLLFCKSGTGTVTVNQKPFDLSPGRLLFLPWGRSMIYQASVGQPFLVGGVHLVPDHDPAQPPAFTIPHERSSLHFSSPARKDLRLPGLEGILSAAYEPEDPLIRLAEYAVALFRKSDQNEGNCRLLGRLFIRDLTAFFSRSTLQPDRAPHPAELTRLLQFIETHLSRPLSLSSLVRFSGKSPSTLCRLFKKSLDATPVETILKMKFSHAGRLLLSTEMTVAEAGRKVGIEDPYYFSKLFKKITSRSPREYRRDHSIL